MGHTNSTANLSLPQFIGTDKPTWLGDINSAFSDIDAYVGTNDAAVSGAVADAASAVSQAASAVSTANAANTTAGNASTAATNAVGTANNAMSLVNQTNIKIGTLATLNTTDKTSIVNAINEVYGMAGSAGSVSVTADGVKTYGQLLTELYGLVDLTKIRSASYLQYGNIIGHIASVSASGCGFVINGTTVRIYMHVASAALANNFDYTTGTYSLLTNQTPGNGEVFEIFY